MTTKEQEFTKLVKEQKNTIYTVCMMFGEDTPVEDLVQQTLINLWKGYDGFEGRSNPGTWVWRVAMNTCLTAQKKEKKHKKNSSSLDVASVDIADAPKEDRQIRMLHERIHKLGVFDRAIVLLWLEDLSYEEIGEIVGISAGNVSVRLVRIREQLKNM